ncbi:thioesterase [Streptacidiphilus sp. PB12-B1b]|uniref:thioesterase II family protein n=1 Tax=Streptacidiphilus sp. PB12-B1b TaxID=2705012 RepID=UPI0015F95C61|nr:alpha/beta fold hydrolase [Streptacidiphilus sp. PB12-B1b]QMU77040.1 thioesterase [Streptacidiphilus sp. PB12-B1b]
MTSGSGGRWITGRYAVGQPRVRLICVPQAGAGAGAFSGWRKHLPDGVEMAPVELPGRGTRYGEPMPDGVDALADALFEGLLPELDPPYLLFGHSLGGALAYEASRRIQQAGLPAPLATLVSGSRAPQTPSLRTMSAAADDALLAWVLRNGGLPEELLEYPGFVEEIIRAVRADLRYAEEYLVPEPAALGWPLHVFGGTEDEITPPEQLPRWQRCAAGEFGVTMLPGGHGFPHADPEAMLAAVRAVPAVRAVLPQPPLP